MMCMGMEWLSFTSQEISGKAYFGKLGHIYSKMLRLRLTEELFDLIISPKSTLSLSHETGLEIPCLY